MPKSPNNMTFINPFKKPTNKTNDTPPETEVLYSSRKQNSVIEGIELPKNWSNFSKEELITQAKNAILELSKTSNSDLKAKDLGFKDAKHLMDLCFDFILK